MKNAKRDITLNERDSIEDMAQTERTLFYAFSPRVVSFVAQRNEGSALEGYGARGEKRIFSGRTQSDERVEEKAEKFAEVRRKRLYFFSASCYNNTVEIR